MSNVARGLSLCLFSLLGGCSNLMQGPSQTVNVDVYPRTASQVTCLAQNERGSYTLVDVPSAMMVDRAYGPLAIKCRSIDGWVGDLIVASGTNVLGAVGSVATGPVSVVEDIRSGGVFTYPNSVVVQMHPTVPPPIADAAVGPITRSTPVYHSSVVHHHRSVRQVPHVVRDAPSK